MMENENDESKVSRNIFRRMVGDDSDRTYFVGDMLANISDGPIESFGSGASLFYVLSPATIDECRVGEWISKKERNGLKLHSIRLFQIGIDYGTISYRHEIQIAQGGPILVLGFKEA